MKAFNRDTLVCRFPFKQSIIDAIKVYPGVRWNKAQAAWLVPVDVGSKVAGIALAHQMKVSTKSGKAPVKFPYKLNDELYSFQLGAVEKAIGLGGKLLISFETGLGKTPTAIEILRHKKPVHSLVICPALVRDNWAEEVDRWWLGDDYPKPVVIEKGGMPKVDGPGLWITSYELAKHPSFATVPWGAIVLDEAHYIKNSKSPLSKAIKKLCQKNPNAITLALTATPIGNDPKDLWHILDCLWPSRFGTFWQFCKRYSNMEHNGYGWSIFGVLSENQEELRNRLDWCSVRATKLTYRDLLPPLMVQAIRIRSTHAKRFREIREDWGGGIKKHLDRIGQDGRGGDLKVGPATTQALDALESGSDHVCILTHLKATAYEIAAKLGKGVEVIVATGDDSPSKRMEKIRKAKASKQSVLVATMHSIGIGIDLTFCDVAIFAELDYSPTTMIQTLGRFSRLSGKSPTTIYFLILEGTLDELINHSLKEKIRNINKLIDAGSAESELEGAFTVDESDEKEFFQRIQEVADGQIDVDAYLGG